MKTKEQPPPAVEKGIEYLEKRFIEHPLIASQNLRTSESVKAFREDRVREALTITAKEQVSVCDRAHSVELNERITGEEKTDFKKIRKFIENMDSAQANYAYGHIIGFHNIKDISKNEIQAEREKVIEEIEDMIKSLFKFKGRYYDCEEFLEKLCRTVSEQTEQSSVKQVK